MPFQLSDAMLEHMIERGYLIISPNQEHPMKQHDNELLYEFGQVPPIEDGEAREAFFALYREATDYMLAETSSTVYRPKHRRRPRRR